MVGPDMVGRLSGDITHFYRHFAAQVRVTHDDDVFWCAGFCVADGLITAGVEHRVTARSESPPQWRQRFTIPADLF